MVADTGSTNGTFIEGQRIAYGKAAEVKSGAALMFGLINVSVQFAPIFSEANIEAHPANTETYKVGEFEFSNGSATTEPAPTVPNLTVPKTEEAPMSKAKRDESPANERPVSELQTDVSPQPALIEAEIKVTDNGSGSRKRS